MPSIGFLRMRPLPPMFRLAAMRLIDRKLRRIDHIDLRRSSTISQFAKEIFVGAHLLFIGGEDHHLRLPFMLALKARGYRVTAAASCAPGPFVRAGVDFRPIQFDRFVSPRRDLASLRGLKELLERVDADVAHCFDTKLSLLVAFVAHTHLRTSIVRTINGRGWIYSSRSPVATALRRIYPSLQRLAAKSTAATIFQHSGDQSFFAKNRLVGNSHTAVIPGSGIDVEGFERAVENGPSALTLRRELGLGDAQVVITVARVTRQKGIPTLLEAARLVRLARPNVKFLIVGPRKGEGPFAMSDEEMSRHADYVIAPGERTDIPSLLAMADVFAFPSEYAEGVPRALMEAALSRSPIVASDIDGCREVIRDGWNGRLTPMGDPEALADGILSLLRDRDHATAMASRGPATIRKTFCLDAVVARHAEIYERVLAEDSSACRTPRTACLWES
jgi:glycosyltransferase involved in cell wall biosynthesis